MKLKGRSRDQPLVPEPYVNLSAHTALPRVDVLRVV